MRANFPRYDTIEICGSPFAGELFAIAANRVTSNAKSCYGSALIIVSYRLSLEFLTYRAKLFDIIAFITESQKRAASHRDVFSNSASNSIRSTRDNKIFLFGLWK